MVIQPAVEVNPVVDPPPAQANRRWPNPSQQGLADAEISGSLRAIHTANGANINSVLSVNLTQNLNPRSTLVRLITIALAGPLCPLFGAGSSSIKSSGSPTAIFQTVNPSLQVMVT